MPWTSLRHASSMMLSDRHFQAQSVRPSAAARLLDVAPGFSHPASRYFCVSHFDQHRHHGAGCVLVGIEVDDEVIGCKAIKLCRIIIAEEAVRPGRQTPPDSGLSRCLRGNVRFVADSPRAITVAGDWCRCLCLFPLRLRRRRGCGQRPACSRLRKPDVGLASTGEPASPITTRCESTRATKAGMPRSPAATRSSTTEANSVRYTAAK